LDCNGNCDEIFDDSWMIFGDDFGGSIGMWMMG
jgi:hypothetical protein